MRKSTKVVHVYHELRDALPHTVSPADVFAHATALVELYEEDSTKGYQPGFTLHRGGTIFEERATDTVMCDGGWRVLCQAEPALYQQEEAERHEVQDAFYRSGMTEYFPDLRL